MTIAEVCSITQALKQAPAEPQLSSLMALHTVTHTLSAVAILLTAMIALATFAESNDWLQAQFPTLNPIPAFHNPIPLPSSTAGHPPGKYWRSTASAYDDLRYLCPGFHANVMAAHFHSSTPVNPEDCS